MTAKLSDDEVRWRIRLGVRFKNMREHRNVKQVEIAHYLNIPPSVWNRFERGNATLSVYNFLRACRYLRADANTMLGRKRKKGK